MWLVRIALRRPYTFIVMAMLVVVTGVASILRMPTDIFPAIDIPVVSVIFNYGGLPPAEMEKRVVNNYERFLTTTVNDIEHTESQTLNGVAVVKVFLQPGASPEAAIAQITAVSQTAIRQMPPGASPPLIIQYSATNVPILQATLSSDTLGEQQLFDMSNSFIRSDITTVRGAQLPLPYGGKQRQIVVDLDPSRLYGWGLSPRDVSTSLGEGNVILPSGTARFGETEYPVLLNGSPTALDELGDIPIKSFGDKTIRVRDVANVRDGYAPQASMVHVNGQRTVLLSVLKNGNASTLDVAAGVRSVVPKSVERTGTDLKVSLLFDQSIFVRSAVEGVVKEAAIAALLTAGMILLFLGSWRSTLIVVVSIPLSILASITILGALGQSLNVMTLGGLSLAVGILVDDATVEIENIHRNLAEKKPLVRAILDGAQQIATPAFVSTLCICIVFVPVGFIAGAAKSLFVPLALAVVFAMLMSYLLSRTLVPTMVKLLLAKEAREHLEGHDDNVKGSFRRFFDAFNRGFERLRSGYGALLAWALAHRGVSVACFAIYVAGSVALAPLVGRDFFPSVDAGLIKLHVRGAPGTRIEETERSVADIEETIKDVIPEREIDTMLDNLGTPSSGINLSLSEGALVSQADGQIMISLKADHAPTEDYVRALRARLNHDYPSSTFFFLAPDISTQVLNFGLAAPIDVQIVGPVGAEEQSFALAQRIAAEVRKVPGAVDVHLAQVASRPQIEVDVDRQLADQVGLSQRNIASDLLISLSGTAQTAPSYWVDKRGVQYLVAVLTPFHELDDLDAIRATPLSVPASSDTTPALLSNVATFQRTSGPVNITHHNGLRTFDVLANVDGTDLGSVNDGVRAVLARMKSDIPKGTTVTVKGQAESMESSFKGLAVGLVFAVLLVYLLMVVNFQSWLDPFIILMALPGAIAGIVWMLFVTHTTISVPALMGAIMCVGVATANSVLVVTFANEQRQRGALSATDAALAAGMTRLRPVMMTAFAMIAGMLPMSLGFGEGGEQNAPLGRAVIGGLLVATFSTLFFVPVVYSLLRSKPPAHDPSELTEQELA
ncbi:MAG: efflux RND transporter permease subunit [Polyangiaceae bacterium]